MPRRARPGATRERPDLGGGRQARLPGHLPPRPRAVRAPADAARRLPQLQPRHDGHVLAARSEPGDEPHLRRRLLAVPGAAGRADRARLQLDPAADVADGRDVRGAQGRSPAPDEEAVRVRLRQPLVLDAAARLPGGPRRAREGARVDAGRQASALLDRLPALDVRRPEVDDPPDPGAAARGDHVRERHRLQRSRARFRRWRARPGSGERVELPRGRQRPRLLPGQRGDPRLAARAVQEPRCPRRRDGLVPGTGRRVRA